MNLIFDDKIKILDDKIKTNQAQCDLDREATKISSLSSGELKKYKYVTDGDLGYKPGVVEKPKFEYAQLGQVYNKGQKRRTFEKTKKYWRQKWITVKSD